MSKARDLANLISQGNPLSDGAISVAEISDLTASAAELNKLDGVTATTAELNQVVGATSALQTQLDNISVTSGSLTKTFTQNETADITLSQGITSAPVVSATKEVPQTGVSTKGNWDVNSTASNYDFHNTAANVTLTPSTVANTSISLTQVGSDLDINTYGPKPSPFFKPDGTKMYICSQSNAYIYTYSLSTAWDLSTATWDGFSHGVSTNAATSEGDPTDIFFKPDGTVLFYVGQSNDQVRAFNLSTAWDLSTATISTTNDFSTASQETAPKGLYFKPDGTRMYIVGGNGNATFQYNLSAAWDLTSASYTSSFNSAIQDNGPNGISFNSTGTRMYVLGGSSGNGKLFQYNVATAWDITSASYANVFADFTGINAGTSPHGIFIDSSETRVYFGCGSSGSSRMYQFSNGTDALALGSGSFASTDVGKRIVGNGGDVVLTSTGGAFSTTGGSAFTDNSTIAAGSWQMFGLKSAGDADGITMSGFAVASNTFNTVAPLLNTTNTSSASGTFAGYVGFCVSQNGLHAYGAKQSNGQIHHWTMSTAYDLSTISQASDTLATGYTQSAGDTHISSDGTKVYATNNNYPYSGDFIKQWTLSTPYDLSTAGSGTEVSFNGGGQAAATSNGSGGQLDFSPDGTKLYYSPYAQWAGNTTHGHSHPTNSVNTYNNSGLVFQYTLNTAYDITGTKNYDGAVRVPMKGNNYASICVTSDGKFLLQTIYNAEHMFIYPLTTDFDITTATHTTEQYFSRASQNSSGDASQGGISICHVDGKLFNYSYSRSRADSNAYATLQNVSVPLQQYNIAVTNSGGRIDSQYFTDINSMTAAQNAATGTVHYAVSTDGRTTWSVAKGTDGVRPIVRNNSGTWQYNNDGGTTAGYSLASGSYDSSVTGINMLTGTGEASGHGIFVKPDGTKLYHTGTSTNAVFQYSLSTANDITTASYENKSFSFDSNYNYSMGDIFFKPDGTKMYAVGSGMDRVSEYALSTAWDISTTSYNNAYVSVGSQESSPKGMFWKPDGTAFYIIGYSQETVYRYNLTTAWDVSTASYANQSFTVTSQATVPRAIEFNPTGTKMFIGDDTNGNTSAPWAGIYEYNLSTAWDVSTASYSNNFLSFQTTNDYNFEGFRFISNGTKLWAHSRSGNKIYQFSTASSAYGTSTTWVDGTTNDELYTLQEALGAQAFNRMDKTQLDAVADANHFSTGSSLDLMIALRMDAAASTLPTSDGVTLNYDAAALNEGAVLGTDYDFFFPANNKVQIKSLAAQNLKVRVV